MALTVQNELKVNFGQDWLSLQFSNQSYLAIEHAIKWDNFWLLLSGFSILWLDNNLNLY